MKKCPSYLLNRAVDDETFPELLKYFTMKITDVEDYPPEVIRVDDKVFGTLGNFSIITGKPKSGKTFNVSAIAAAAISGKLVLNYTVTLPADRKMVLYIDTEQARPHCRTVIRRIYKMAGMTAKDKSNLMFCPLREMNDVMRIAFIEKCLKDFPTIGLVIIDGIRDLLKDINSQVESNLVINKLMEWTAFYDNHIVGVIHLNKNDDNTRGTLGTESNNKAESTMLTSLVANSNMLRFKVSCEMSRSEPFESFFFYLDSNHLPQVDVNYGAIKKKKTSLGEITASQHREALDTAFASGSITSHNSLVQALERGYQAIGLKRGRTWLVSVQKMMTADGVISESVNDQNVAVYHYHPQNLNTITEPRLLEFSETDESDESDGS